MKLQNVLSGSAGLLRGFLLPTMALAALTACQATSVPSSSVMTDTVSEAREKEHRLMCELWGGPVPLPADVYDFHLSKDTQDALDLQSRVWIKECGAIL